MRHARTAAAVIALSALLLTGCGGNEGGKDQAAGDSGSKDQSGGSQSTSWFQDTIQGTWSCQKNTKYGAADLQMFNDTDKPVGEIHNPTQVTVEGTNWKASDSDELNAEGTLAIDGSNLTINVGPYSQVIHGVPTSAEEGASQKAVLVEGSKPEKTLSVLMPSPTEIDLTDGEDYSTQCLKY